MKNFEINLEKAKTQEDQNKELTDLAVKETMKRIKDQIFKLKENSDDPVIKHHLKNIDEKNIELIDKDDLITFNEIVVKGKWKERIKEIEKKEKIKKYEGNERDDEEIIKAARKSGVIPAEDVRLSFRALIDHYARDCELKEQEKQKAIEKELLKKEAEQTLVELKKDKPYIAAHVEKIDFNALKKSDYRIIIGLNPHNFGDYDGKLREYFKNRISGKSEDEAKSEIMHNPRYAWYCMVRELMNQEPINPDQFISSL